MDLVSVYMTAYKILHLQGYASARAYVYALEPANDYEDKAVHILHLRISRDEYYLQMRAARIRQTRPRRNSI